MKRRIILISFLFCFFNAGPNSFAQEQQRGYSIPLIDLSHEIDRQVIVDREPDQYLGHPSTVLLEDGRTMIAVLPQRTRAGARLS